MIWTEPLMLNTFWRLFVAFGRVNSGTSYWSSKCTVGQLNKRNDRCTSTLAINGLSHFCRTFHHPIEPVAYLFEPKANQSTIFLIRSNHQKEISWTLKMIRSAISPMVGQAIAWIVFLFFLVDLIFKAFDILSHLKWLIEFVFYL